jgi:hypothetical protein
MRSLPDLLKGVAYELPRVIRTTAVTLVKKKSSTVHHLRGFASVDSLQLPIAGTDKTSLLLFFRFITRSLRVVICAKVLTKNSLMDFAEQQTERQAIRMSKAVSTRRTGKHGQEGLPYGSSRRQVDLRLFC